MENELADLIGHIVSGEVTDESDQFYVISVAGRALRLAKKELMKPLKHGSHFKGFAYENDHHQLQITRQIPRVQIDRYAFGTVVKAQRGLGVFIDIGLANKDVVVSLDDLPEIPQLWPQAGDRLMVALRVDKKARMWAVPADETVIKAVSQAADYGQLKNQSLTVTAYRLKLTGTLVLTKTFNLGFIPPEERQEEPRLGQELATRVIGQFPDGTLKLTTRPRAHEAIDDDAAMILATLQHAPEGKLNFTDKSAPDAIKAYFGISKGQFKRAVGHLMKARLVSQHDGFLWLNQESD